MLNADITHFNVIYNNIHPISLYFNQQQTSNLSKFRHILYYFTDLWHVGSKVMNEVQTTFLLDWQSNQE